MFIACGFLFAAHKKQIIITRIMGIHCTVTRPGELYCDGHAMVTALLRWLDTKGYITVEKRFTHFLNYL